VHVRIPVRVLVIQCLVEGTRAVDLIALTRAINALKKFAIKNFNALIVRVN
jgi:hypothetical protein